MFLLSFNVEGKLRMPQYLTRQQKTSNIVNILGGIGVPIQNNHPDTGPLSGNRQQTPFLLPLPLFLASRGKRADAIDDARNLWENGTTLSRSDRHPHSHQTYAGLASTFIVSCLETRATAG